MSFYVGQKVVCVSKGYWQPVSVGSVYTISDIVIDGCGCILLCLGIPSQHYPGFAAQGEIGICTHCGIKSPAPFHNEQPFHSSRFRPLDALAEQMDRIEAEGAPVEQPEPAFA